MSIATRSGDDGNSKLPGGQRVPKDHPRLLAAGAVEELNAALGEVGSLRSSPLPAAALSRIQCELWDLTLELATPKAEGDAARSPSLSSRTLHSVEEDLRRIESSLPPQTTLVLPGGSVLASKLMTARAVCRRAERQVVALARDVRLSGYVLQYLNRLGDLLFVAARAANRNEGIEDPEWIPADERPVPE